LTYAFTVIAYEEQGNEGVLTFATPGLAPDLHGFLLTRDMSAAALLLKELGGNDFSLSRFCLSKPPTPDSVQVLGCAPSYAANSNSLAFDRSFLSLPLPQANAVTVSMCEQMCTQLMQRRIARAGMTALVQHYLITPDIRPPDLCSMSELLHVSTRTLKRRLKEEGTTFRKLLADARSRNAINLLKDGHMNLTEIAERLGFSDLSSFSQAFKRWHGISPSEFSQQKNNFGDY
jgi:AraC-like DNA-binding protein